MRNLAGDMLYSHMQRAFDENPRGELYRSLSLADLWNKLSQNLAEVQVAMEHGNNDLGDKLADIGNYVAFIYRNWADPLMGDNPEFAQLKASMHGMQFSWEQAQEVIRLINERTMGVADVSEFGRHPYTEVKRVE